MARIAFINEDSFFRCGVASIIAVLKKNGHQCDVFLEKEEKDLLSAVGGFSPDVLAFSCTSGEHNWVMKTAGNLKKRLNLPVILGGPHPTFFPRIIEQPEIDIVCRGEGEKACLELLNRIDSKQDITNIENLTVKTNGDICQNPVGNLIEDLDSLPFMDRDYYDKYESMRQDRLIHMITDRGCPFDCTFCYNAKAKELYKGKGRYLRQRSPLSVIEELKLLVKRYPKANAVRFYDDLFVYNLRKLHELLDLYKREIKLAFICNVRADFLTEDLVSKLKNSGCDKVSLGVETGNEELRRRVLNKRITNQQLLKAAELCHKYNLRMSTLNMIGLPGETIDNAMETIILNHKMNAAYSQIAIYQPFPGTALGDYAKEQGLIDADYNITSMTPFYYKSVLRQKNIKQLSNIQVFFWLAQKYPIFIPLIRQIIKLPRTRFHDFFMSLPMLRIKLKYGDQRFLAKVYLLLRRVGKVIVSGESGMQEKGV